MNTYYDNILIPVDRSFDTEKALTSAIEFATPCVSIIHLVQQVRSWKFIRRSNSYPAYGSILNNDPEEYVKALLNLMHWKSFIEAHKRGISVKIHIKEGFFLHSLVLEITRKERPTLVIMASHSRRNWISFGKNISAKSLARRSGCKVLSIKTNIQAANVEQVETLLEPMIIRRNQFEKDRFVVYLTRTFHGFLSHN